MAVASSSSLMEGKDQLSYVLYFSMLRILIHVPCTECFQVMYVVGRALVVDLWNWDVVRTIEKSQQQVLGYRFQACNCSELLQRPARQIKGLQLPVRCHAQV